MYGNIALTHNFVGLFSTLRKDSLETTVRQLVGDSLHILSSYGSLEPLFGIIDGSCFSDHDHFNLAWIL